ncbi:MAG: RNase adapter RapZ [Deltaproteobacteria bacterium]|nr:MAG: RNase adapter RapZ [Deltaproteobacteria bacterium]
MSSDDVRIIFLSGLSGSGKSTAMAALEDLSFYCVDNLPPALVETFLDLCAKATPPIHKVALAIDAREVGFLAGFPALIEQIRERGARAELLFLECSNDVLVNRYRETRRVHPLSRAGSVEQGIEVERQLLGDVARVADHAIDTSRLNVHQLREIVARHVTGGARSTVVNLDSFGFRYGTPPSAELLFDVRFLPNPHFERELRERTGEDPDVAEFVLKHARTEALLERLGELFDFLLPLYEAEGKAYIRVGVGCTGGRHRSVVIANALAERFRKAGRDVNVTHRDIERTE